MDTRTSVLERLALTGMAASVAESVTFPVDMTKTRMQLHGERTTSWSMATRIAKDEGVVGFYRGLSPALLRHCVYTSLRIVIYEQMREVLAAEGEESLPLYKRAFAGASAGVLGQAVASPTDLVKVRMQADGRRVVQGLKPRYAGMSDAMRTIMKEEGVKGLYKGLGPNLYRAGLVNLGELTTYDTAKHFLLDSGWKDNLTTHTASAIVSGFFATAFSCPADVVKSRIMAADAQGKYSGTIDCLVKTVRHEGVSALYKGFFPSWARLGPFQFTFWIVYEQLRQVLGMKGF